MPLKALTRYCTSFFAPASSFPSLSFAQITRQGDPATAAMIQAAAAKNNDCVSIF
jgi:hypothetical protein